MVTILEIMALVVEKKERVFVTAKLYLDVNLDDNYFNDNANVNDN